MARITKQMWAARAFFQREVGEFLRTRGATEGKEPGEWNLSTPAGNLWILVHDDEIFQRFDDVAAGRKWTKDNARYGAPLSNPYSGKWNFYIGDEWLENSGCGWAGWSWFIDLLLGREA